MRVHRFGVTATALALLVSACGGAVESSEAPATTPPGIDTTVAQGEPAVETTAPDTVSTDDGTISTTDTRPAPDPNREIAPDFTLALADGSTFVLSEETRPVFMVFWAEW